MKLGPLETMTFMIGACLAGAACSDTTTTPAQLAVVSQSGASITFFDASTGAERARLGVMAEPHELELDVQRRLLYCSHTYRTGHYDDHGAQGHEISVIDVDTHRVVQVVDISPARAPHGLALDARRELLYATVEESDTESGGVVVVDTAAREVVGRISTGAKGPHWFVLTPDGKKGYAANKEAPFVSVLDLVERKLVAKVEVPGGSEGLDISPDGTRLFVAGPKLSFDGGPSAPPGVCVIDTAADKVVHMLPTEHPPVSIHVTSKGMLLVGQVRFSGEEENPFADGLLSIFDAKTYAPIAQLEMGMAPLTLHSSADGSTAYVSNLLSGSVSVVGLADLRVTSVLPVEQKVGDAGPHGLAHIAPRL